eukprot:11718393-Heterocapsa_arctica.AAC.1
MEKDWQDDCTNLQSDNTVGYLIYAATGMPPRDDQFLTPDNDIEVDQLDDELSADDRLTGDRQIKSATGFYYPSPDHIPQATISPGDTRWGRRRRVTSSSTASGTSELPTHPLTDSALPP